MRMLKAMTTPNPTARQVQVQATTPAGVREPNKEER
jgi:hypothetical protein